MKLFIILLSFLQMSLLAQSAPELKVLKNIVEIDSQLSMELYSKSKGTTEFVPMHEGWRLGSNIDGLMQFIAQSRGKELNTSYSVVAGKANVIAFQFDPLAQIEHNGKPVTVLYLRSEGSAFVSTNQKNSTRPLSFDRLLQINELKNISLQLRFNMAPFKLVQEGYSAQLATSLGFNINSPQTFIKWDYDLESNQVIKSRAQQKHSYNLNVSQMSTQLKGSFEISYQLVESFGEQNIQAILTDIKTNKTPVSFTVNRNLEIESLTIHNWYNVNHKIPYERLELRSDGRIRLWKTHKGKNPENIGLIQDKRILEKLIFGCNNLLR